MPPVPCFWVLKIPEQEKVMGKTEGHHYLQRQEQIDVFGRGVDGRSIELPSRYHRKKVNPMQRKGVGDAYLAGMINQDSATGEIYDHEGEEDDED